jgi:hypothetical protein
VRRCWIVPLLFLLGCGYHFEGSQPQEEVVSVSIPYIKGDREGLLGAELVKALSASGLFDYDQSSAEFTLQVAIIADGDDRIGFRFDRDATTGKLRDNIIGTENRRSVSAQVTVINAHTQEVVLATQVVSAIADYDYVDSNSIRDLTFIEPNGTPQKVLDFSLGQLDSVEGGHDDSSFLIYRLLAQKIVEGLLLLPLSPQK